ncbi:MAG: hypothetical protein LBQ50_06435 [Planctomycetaceae bacterium]|jgi:hypothetical protein|nr:hypothetical protein [Planctomycetaceae bacterium]
MKGLCILIHVNEPSTRTPVRPDFILLQPIRKRFVLWRLRLLSFWFFLKANEKHGVAGHQDWRRQCNCLF